MSLLLDFEDTNSYVLFCASFPANIALVDIHIVGNLKMTRVYNVGIKNIAIELGQTMNKGPRGQQKNIPKKNGQWISSQTQH
ncbi:hypothetical protein VN97_g9747 [Penicillium thymicola]|uniref:Uncharacterized protein n=1 Tax=Penicillium thymicola TaxID=293382 RepID=A0AAI9TAM6_PENTH|nr:hypothetical protein VN97_g9747 [Penicillium thymicola]